MDATAIRTALQVVAALFGAAFAVIFVMGLRRGLAQGFVLFQLSAIPVLGFAFFVLNPVVRPATPGIIYVEVAPVVVMGVVALWWSARRRKMKDAVTTPATLDLQTRVGVVVVAGFVLIVSTYLWLFEPAFAVANVVAYAVWVLIWIPRPWRKRGVDLSIEVAAPPSRVWQYLVDVSIWPRYYVDLEDVKVSPAGPLQVGSRITSRRRVPLIRPTAKASDLKMELQSVVTELVPGVSYTLAALDRQAATKTEVTATSSGSRIDVRTQLVLSVGDSIAGQLLRWPAGVAQFKANSMRSLERLKELLLVPS